MKAKDVLGVGCTYIVKVSGALVPVKLIANSPYGGWIGKNLKTGREIRIRTAAKLRRVVAITDLPHEKCVHDWQEQAGEPPVDVCSSCGAVRR